MPAETRAADDDTIIGIDLGTTNSEVAIVSGGALDRGGGRRRRVPRTTAASAAPRTPPFAWRTGPPNRSAAGARTLMP